MGERGGPRCIGEETICKTHLVRTVLAKAAAQADVAGVVGLAGLVLDEELEHVPTEDVVGGVDVLLVALEVEGGGALALLGIRIGVGDDGRGGDGPGLGGVLAADPLLGGRGQPLVVAVGGRGLGLGLGVVRGHWRMRRTIRIPAVGASGFDRQQRGECPGLQGLGLGEHAEEWGEVGGRSIGHGGPLL